MARPRKDQIMQPLSLRLPEELIEEIDACARKLQEEMPLLEVNRTDALRYLIKLGLTEVRKKAKPAATRSQR
jgi:hypothetical protein